MPCHLALPLALLLTLPAVAAETSGALKSHVSLPATQGLKTKRPVGYILPIVDLSAETQRQVIVDREPGQ